MSEQPEYKKPVEMRLDSLELNARVTKLAYDSLDQRLAALEAQAAPEAEAFAPGKVETQNDGIWVYAFDQYNPQNLRMVKYHDNDFAILYLDYPDHECSRPVYMNAIGLRQVIGAAMTILRMVESEGESRDSAE